MGYLKITWIATTSAKWLKWSTSIAKSSYPW